MGNHSGKTNIKESNIKSKALQYVRQERHAKKTRIKLQESSEYRTYYKIYHFTGSNIQPTYDFGLFANFMQLSAAHEHHEDIDPFVTTLNNHRRCLSQIISFEYGLLDELVRQGVMTSEAAERVQEKITQRSALDQFVHELTRDPELLALKKREFLDALDATQHKHVSNFIQGDGNRSAEYGDDWPLVCCDEKITRMDNYGDKFIELVDTRNGLLTRMLSSKCINNRQLQRIKTGAKDEEKNSVLLNILRRGSLATYNTFIRALSYTKQHQIVSLLAPDLPARLKVPPLSDQQQSRIQINYDALVSILDNVGKLAAQLYSVNCITKHQRVFVESATTQTDRTKRLVDIVRRGSGTDFNKFIKCLNETCQQHVSRILLEDGVVVPMAVSIDGADIWEEDEGKVIDQIAAVLRGTSNKFRELPCETVLKHLTEFRDNAIAILDVKKGTNIVLIYFCGSMRGLHFLFDLYVDEQLREMMQDIFLALLNTRDVGGLRIAKMHWGSPDYNDCVQKLRDFKELRRDVDAGAADVVPTVLKFEDYQLIS